MANIITTYVKVVNLNEETFKRVIELFAPRDVGSTLYVNNVKHFNMIYGTSFDDGANCITSKWMNENVGSTNFNLEFDHEDFTTEVEFVIETTFGVPQEYLLKLTEYLNQFDRDIALYGLYEEEEYKVIGAYVYGYDWDDIEDFDDYDSDRMWDDDDYRDEIMDRLHDHRDALYESYLEDKKEREEEN